MLDRAGVLDDRLGEPAGRDDRALADLLLEEIDERVDLPENPYTAPDCMDSTVDFPMTFRGATSSTRRSAAARSKSASIEISMPGKIAPPRYSPSALIASIVFAVPKSTTIDGPP